MKFQNEALPPSRDTSRDDADDSIDKISSSSDRRVAPVMLKQDEDDLKPRLLINHINVIVTYPHPRIAIGEPIFAEIILKDSLTGFSYFSPSSFFLSLSCYLFLFPFIDKSVPLDSKWKLDMKVDRPDGSCATATCKTDPETELIYGSMEATQTGTVQCDEDVMNVT